MTLTKTQDGEYKGLVVLDGHKVECIASNQSYGGFSYTVYVNGTIVDSDGFTGLRLRDIKIMADTYMVEDSVLAYTNLIQ